MKFKRTVFLTAVFAALGLLLGAGATYAQTVVTRESDPSQAIQINGLVIGDVIYSVGCTGRSLKWKL